MQHIKYLLSLCTTVQALQQVYELAPLLCHVMISLLQFLSTPRRAHILCAHPRQSTHRAPTCMYWPPLFAPRTTPFSSYTQVNRFLPRVLSVPSGVGRNSTLYAFWRKSDCRQGTRRGLWKGFTSPATHFFSFIRGTYMHAYCTHT